jgi:hypothetical protein
MRSARPCRASSSGCATVTRIRSAPPSSSQSHRLPYSRECRRRPADVVRISPTRNVSRLGLAASSPSFSSSRRACTHCWMRCRLAFSETPVLMRWPTSGQPTIVCVTEPAVDPQPLPAPAEASGLAQLGSGFLRAMVRATVNPRLGWADRSFRDDPGRWSECVPNALNPAQPRRSCRVERRGWDSNPRTRLHPVSGFQDVGAGHPDEVVDAASSL